MTIIFSKFDVKYYNSTIAKLNRIRVVLAERELNNKWLSDKHGKEWKKGVTNMKRNSLYG